MVTSHSGQVIYKAESVCETPRRQLSTNRQTSAPVESRRGRQAPQQVDSGSRNLNREGAGKGTEEEATERIVGEQSGKQPQEMVPTWHRTTRAGGTF